MTNYTWSSAVNGMWSNGSDWNPNGIPGSAGGDTATINATGSDYVVTYDESTETIDQFTIDSANATLTFNAGETLTVNSSTTLDAGTINVTAAGVQFNVGNITTAAGTTINVGNSDTLAPAAGGATIYNANLSGLVDIVGTGANLGSSHLGVTLNSTATIEATGGVGTIDFASLSGSGTLEANGATLVVVGSLANTSAQIVISDSASSVFEDTGSVFFGAQLSASFLGSHGEFEYNNASDGNAIFNLSGLNAGASTTTPTNFFDFGNEAVTISSGGTGAGSTGSLVMSNGDTLALSGITGIGGGGWTAIAQSDGSGGTEVFLGSVCYAAGTRVLTAAGERPIESLRPGEFVATLSGNDIILHPVRWIGRRRIDIAAHPRPHTVAPIRILCHAIADEVPHADLLVSPDHGILIDGKLICARQLINGATIRQESNWDAVTYYHLELDAHAILIAEGAPAESYLDTGNRSFFSNAGVPIELYPDLTDESGYPTRETSSCVPFVSDEDMVRPIWQRLADRARALGLTTTVPDMTEDSALYVIADGRTSPAISCQEGRYLFALPPGTFAVRLRSRTARPTDARPWLEDQRQLGVYLSRIVMRWDDEVREIALDHPSLAQGWWAAERLGNSLRRWTDGDALLRLPAVDAFITLEVHADAAGLAYPMNERLRPAA